MQRLEKDGYSREQVIEQLHGIRGSRQIDFRFELLDENNHVKRDITDIVLGGRIEHNALNDIKRTATFHLKDVDTIDWGKDRIKPYVQIRMPTRIGITNSESHEWARGDLQGVKATANGLQLDI